MFNSCRSLQNVIAGNGISDALNTFVFSVSIIRLLDQLPYNWYVSQPHNDTTSDMTQSQKILQESDNRRKKKSTICR